MSEICIVITIVVYLVAMLLVGFAYSKTNNDSTDFYLGGRKMGPLVTAMRIGRSYTEPSLRVSAGARFTVMRLTGKANPVFFIAERTLFFASLIAASGSPTISNLGSPCERSAST